MREEKGTHGALGYVVMLQNIKRRNQRKAKQSTWPWEGWNIKGEGAPSTGKITRRMVKLMIQEVKKQEEKERKI